MEITRDNIKRLFLFEYEYWESKNLNEVKRRVSKGFKFLPVENIVKVVEEIIGNLENIAEYSPQRTLAIRSIATEPAMIYFLIIEEHNIGGKIILIETKHSLYSYEKILTGMRAFSAYAGIKTWLIKLLQPSFFP
ncbi:MAG: hypothetical protein DRN04_13195 [Thermoprotei archaeon]|nr:MAG: hypothetical protein DRN04_13195 [Thermoprotei archaeon]